METPEVKQETPVREPVRVKQRTDLRADLIGNYTEDISPNCPKAKDRKQFGECGLCKKLPNGMVRCEFCHQEFKSKS